MEGSIRNKSHTYLLPLISEVIDIDNKFLPMLKGTFIGVEDTNFENSVALLFDFSFKVPECTYFENKIKDNMYFKKLYDLNNEVLYVFDFPEEYLKEYSLFKLGKYSQFNDDAKELILEYWYRVFKGSKQAIEFLVSTKQILFKDEKLRRKLEKELNVSIEEDAELSSPPILSNEYYKLIT